MGEEGMDSADFEGHFIPSSNNRSCLKSHRFNLLYLLG